MPEDSSFDDDKAPKNDNFTESMFDDISQATFRDLYHAYRIPLEEPDDIISVGYTTTIKGLPFSDLPPPENFSPSIDEKKEYLNTIKVLETSLLSVTSKLDKTSTELEFVRYELAELKALKEEATARADELASKNKELERRLKELHDDAIMRSMMEQMEE